MQLKTTIAPFFAAALAMIPAVAMAADEDKYVELRRLELIDDTCHALKYFERSALDGQTFDALSITDHYAMHRDGRLTDADYDPWLKAADAAAADKARNPPCTAETAALFNDVHVTADRKIYATLVTAFQLGGLSPDDANYRELTDEEKQMAGGFDGFAKQLYGANYDAFVKSAKDLATQNINDAVASENVLDLAIDADLTFDDLSFEFYAEGSGMRVFAVPSVNGYGAGVFQPDGTPVARVIDGPTKYKINGEAKAYGVLAMTPDHELRLLTFGAGAKALPDATRVQLFVRTRPGAAGKQPWEYYSDDGWHALATAYPAKRLDKGCFDGPCFAFPAAAFAAMKATAAGEYADLFIGTDDTMKPFDNGTDNYKTNSVGNYRFNEFLQVE